MKKPNKNKAAIAYSIIGHDLAAHLFRVTLTVAQPAEGGQIFALPAWIPGSYMIREFSRNIVRIRAEANGEPVALTKLDKHSWQAAPLKDRGASLTLHYEIYAWDLSVRAAHLDQNHASIMAPASSCACWGRKTSRMWWISSVRPILQHATGAWPLRCRS
jgi:predicted metalloprotease with PDZ domain